MKREGKEMEMVLRVGEIEKVKKDRQYRLPALEITGKNGQVSRTLLWITHELELTSIARIGLDILKRLSTRRCF